MEFARQALRASGSQLAGTIERIIDNEIKVQTLPTQSRFQVAPLSAPIPLLRAADASAWENPDLVEVKLMAAQGAAARRLEFVPKCEYCDHILAFSEAAAPIVVTQDLQIPCPSCAGVPRFPLEYFGIFREGQRVYIWSDLQQFGDLSDVPLPPSPEVSGDEVLFRWNPGMLNGDPTSTILRLRFPHATVTVVQPQQIKFDRLLVPGELDKFRGHPIRPEWMFAIDALPEIINSGDVVSFRNMRVKGIRSNVSLPAYPRAACRIDRELQLGVYPKPLYPGWHRHRIFWSTTTPVSTYTGLVVKNDAPRTVIGPTVAGITEWNDTPPLAISLEEAVSGEKASTGSTWSFPASPAGAATAQPLYVGIDFGTTSSVIYFDKEDGKKQALTLEDILGAAEVIAGCHPARASFLPVGSPTLDPTFLPSALWFSGDGGYSPIRWIMDAPSPGHRAAHGFKWDAAHEVLRRQYLDELLFLCLPAVFTQAFPHGGITPNWNLGFAFPLAFSDPQRAEYKRNLTELRHRLDGYASGNPVISTISESAACVGAFGQHGFGEVFLIADLGGGSLDVALFELVRDRNGAQTAEHFQVGSAKIGGESFVTALSRHIGADAAGRENAYWRIRDAILTQSASRSYGGFESVFAGTANRFLPIPLELLRVMASAFALNRPEKRVQVVLVGNGWRIAEYQTGTQRASQTARREVEKSFEMFGVPTLTPYEGAFENPKHLVAIGALQNAKPDGRNELDETEHRSKMPAGRKIEISNGAISLQWHDLVGPDEQNLPLGLQLGDLDIDRQISPPAPPKWEQRLSVSLPDLEQNPSVPAIRSRLKVIGSGLDKGPLQAILEQRAEEI